MSEWQPIETAPIGCPILVFDPDFGAMRVAEHMTAIEDGTCAWVYARCLAWETHLSTGISFQVHAPTHWMPLPEPPVTP